MKVRELRKALEGVADDLEVVSPGSDHSYQRVYSAVTQPAEKYGHALFEYFDDFNMNVGSEKVEVFVVA